jgi:hypothetical protein
MYANGAWLFHTCFYRHKTAYTLARKPANLAFSAGMPVFGQHKRKNILSKSGNVSIIRAGRAYPDKMETSPCFATVFLSNKARGVQFGFHEFQNRYFKSQKW